MSALVSTATVSATGMNPPGRSAKHIFAKGLPLFLEREICFWSMTRRTLVRSADRDHTNPSRGSLFKKKDSQSMPTARDFEAGRRDVLWVRRDVKKKAPSGQVRAPRQWPSACSVVFFLGRIHARVWSEVAAAWRLAGRSVSAVGLFLEHMIYFGNTGSILGTQDLFWEHKIYCGNTRFFFVAFWRGHKSYYARIIS